MSTPSAFIALAIAWTTFIALSPQSSTGS
jgi:hypothetical protein